MKIISPDINVKFPPLLASKRKLTQIDIPPDDKLFTHFYSTYFKPAMTKHKSGDYGGAMDLYRRAADEGSRIAYFNLGNYYLFGVGVERDVGQFIEYWKRGGHLNSNNAMILRLLSNISLFSDSSAKPTCLFIVTHHQIHSPSQCPFLF